MEEIKETVAVETEAAAPEDVPADVSADPDNLPF